MVKHIYLLLLTANILFANFIDEEAQNILGQNYYQSQKKFLKILFKNEKVFYIGDRVDIHKVIEVLSQNSLLPRNLGKTQNLSLSFATEQNNPLIFMKLMQDSLNSIGYSHISSKKVMRDSSGFLWKLTIKSASSINLLLLSEELEKRNCHFTKVKRYSKTRWRYNIDIVDIDIVTNEIDFNQKVRLKKPLNPYWLYVDRAKTLVLNSSKGNRWHPYIVFYDRDLQVIDIIKKHRKSYNEELKIPKNAKYAKVSDIFTLENLKRGLTVYISK